MEEKRRVLISNPKLTVPFPNILFLEWLEKWQRDAKRRDLNSQYCYSKAIDSLLRYPLPFESPKEATILKSVGPGIAEKLEKCWKKYIQDNPGIVSLVKPNPTVTVCDTMTTNIKKNNASKKSYIPKYRSIGYGVLVALLCNTAMDTDSRKRTNLNRAEILMHGQQYGDMNAVKFQQTINTLLRKNLIEIIPDRIVRYTLTDLGVELAEKLFDAHTQLCTKSIIDCNLQSNNHNPLTYSANSITQSYTNNSNPMYTLPKGSFDIVLLIDQIELNNNPQILTILANRIKYEIRKLNIGDFIWIAKSKMTPFAEIVLDCLVERKTVADLSSSIIDGRFHEQKCRIAHSSNIRKAIYLIEGNVSCNQSGLLPEANLLQAISNTIVRSKFLVKQTKSFADTVDYLVNMTKYLESKYQSEDIEASIEVGENKLLLFNVFNDQSQKSKLLTNQEMMIALLMQVKGVSFEKALAVSDLYPTFADLYDAFSRCIPLEPPKKKRKKATPILINTQHTDNQNNNSSDRASKSRLLADIQLRSGKKLGKALSEYIYEIMN